MWKDSDRIMNEDIRIDNHKLMFHPDRVSSWLNNKITYPIYVEISPCNHCNHRCTFCSFNFTGYKPLSLRTSILKDVIYDMGKKGIRAIMYAGEGEPLLHKDIISIINHTKMCGIDVAVTSNGVLMDKTFVEGCLKSLSWIKISVDADSDSIYEKIHGCKKGDLDKVFNNLEYAVKYKKDNNLDCTIGTQAILLEENVNDISNLVIDMKSIGVDYIVIKPYTNHIYRKKKMNIPYNEILDMVSEYSNNDFKVIIRKDAFKRLETERKYECCYALDFWSYIDSKGDVYACSNFLSNKDYVYGNIYKKSFEEIWKNRNIKISNISDCRLICRMDKINQYLWELKNLGDHVNFI